MTDNKLNEIIQTSLEKIKELSETGTVVGEPINTAGGTVIIPVSKVSLGFASGGVELGNKKKNADNSTQTRDPSFGGGGGTGLTISPVGFLVVSSDGNVSMLSVTPPSVTAGNPISAVGDILERSPDIIRRLKEVFSKDKQDEYKADKVFVEAEENENK